MDKTEDFGRLSWDYENDNGEVFLKRLIVSPPTKARAIQSLDMIQDWIKELNKHYDNIAKLNL